VITDGARSLGDEAAVPVVWIQPVADLDVFNAMLRMIKEAAITDDRVLAPRDNGKLRWNASAIPAHDFLNERDGLFAFGENAQ
jgi:hypothetical protein